MSVMPDHLKFHRRHLMLQINHAACLAQQNKNDEMVAALDDLRRLAQNIDLKSVVALVYQIEAMAARNWSWTMAQHYFNALEDAASGCDGGRKARHAILASVAIRTMR